METKTTTVKKKVSEIMVIAGMALLLTYLTDAAVGQGETGFFALFRDPRNVGQRGVGASMHSELGGWQSSPLCQVKRRERESTCCKVVGVTVP